MQLKKIQVGKWYETTSGIGECVAAGGTHPPSVKLNIHYPLPRGVIFMSPRNVLKEVEKPQSRTALEKLK